MADNFVNALVRTVAGQQDAAIQLLDQSPVAFDQIIFGDLMADLAMQLSGQLIAGSGTNGQLTGLYTAGTLGTSTGASSSGYVVNNNSDAWTAAIRDEQPSTSPPGSSCRRSPGTGSGR